MKLNFSKSLRRLKGKSLPVLISLLLSPLMVMGTDSIFYCTSNIDNSNLPQVDATSFYNSGTWNISTEPLPYQTANTLNYTNEGTMVGAVGWEFDFGSSTLPHSYFGGTNLSASFFNDSFGTIEADNGYIVNPPNSLYLSQVSYLLIGATNIVNQGTLIAGSGGLMALTGSNVNLTRSTLQISPIVGQGSLNDIALTNYSADTAIYDEYWVTNNGTMDSSSLWNGSNVTSPTFLVDAYSRYPFCILTSNILAPNGPDPITFVPTFADSFTTNGPVGTNGLPAQIFNQAVFVYTSDPNITASNHFWANSGNVSNLFETATVKLTSKLGDTLYLVDTLASSTNSGYLKDASLIPGYNPLSPCTGLTYRPANYVLERIDSAFTNGAPGNGTPTNSFFYSSSVSNKFVSTFYAAYSAYVDDLAQNPSGGAVTNLSGRILINATNLDLTRAVVTNQGGLIAIHADNFIGSTGAVVSCQNLSYNLGSAVGNLNVTNLAASSRLPGLHGSLYAWSALWTNGMNVVSGSGTNAMTNTIELDFYVLLVDARGLSSTVPVTVQDLILQSTCTNMVVSDNMTVANTLFFGGQRLTLQGSLSLSGNVQSWNSAVAPSLLYFTNNGTLTVPQDAHFGDDTAAKYAAFVNNGIINVGGGETINSVYYQENGGIEGARNGIFVTASTGLIQNAFIESYHQNVNFTAGTLQLGNSMVIAGTSLNFSVTNSLFDNGSFNALSCSNGFNLFVAPQSGSLLGSTITSIIPGQAEVGHAWAGSDFGPTASGLSSNVAIGTLSLVAQNPSLLPLFHFYGATGSNAMYVKTLDLSQLTTNAANLASMIQIDPGMKIYFSQVLLGFAPTSGQSAANFLTNAFPGQFIQDANVGLVPSSAITISSTAFNSSGHSFVLTWTATAGATYSILKTNVLTAATVNWPVIKSNYPAGGAAGGPLSYTDTTTISPAYYKVRSP